MKMKKMTVVCRWYLFGLRELLKRLKGIARASGLV